MNLVLTVKNYIIDMIKETQPGYKVMLMDKETTSYVSIIMGMSEIMKHEVYMFERLDQLSHRENMSYLKCIVFIRPTSENVSFLCKELMKPRYGSYYVYFSNVVSKNEVKLLAEADESEVVKEVQEIYIDFLPYSPYLFSFNQDFCSDGLKWIPNSLDACIHGLSSVLFSLEIMPQIRYQKNSQMCKILADNIRQNLAKESSLYTGNSSNNSVLLIIDRRDDPVTPILHQWTYEAMVHELLGSNKGRVNLSHIPDIPDELKEIIMIPAQDEFYAKSMCLNYGDIGQTIKELMDEYQKKLSMQQKVESITDMKHFVENYPRFKKMSGTVSKHVTVLGELSRIVTANKLLDVSECQQELICGFDHSQVKQHIHSLLISPGVKETDAVNLVALYALRYENHPNSELKQLVAALRKRKVDDDQIKNISNVLDYGGSHRRQNRLFESNLLKDVSSIKRRFFKGIKGVDNVYTQHKPLLLDLLNNMSRGMLSDELYPFVSGHQNSNERLQSIIVFIVGGATYEESSTVNTFNQTSPINVILGGSQLHNSESFLKSVANSMENVPRRQMRL